MHGGSAFPDNKVTKYYKYIQVPFTEVYPRNRAVKVNRKTWENELAKYIEPCKDSLILPPTKTTPPFFIAITSIRFRKKLSCRRC
ncbi:hypothetical protein Elgi_11240 [Paenibacillus elgii]|nr:hypothetical protein Elgi_11240 [Paenibacillus elgii]